MLCLALTFFFPGSPIIRQQTGCCQGRMRLKSGSELPVGPVVFHEHDEERRGLITGVTTPLDLHDTFPVITGNDLYRFSEGERSHV